MKLLKLTLLISGTLMLATSCRKNDFIAEPPIVTAEATPVLNKWASLANWSSMQSENTTTYFNRIADSLITTSVAKKGMILVYKNDGSSVKALPLQDGNVSWHYQVSKGSIRINSEGSNGKDLSQARFAYFIITPEKLATLEASGKTKLDLLDLTYEQAALLQ